MTLSPGSDLWTTHYAAVHQTLSSLALSWSVHAFPESVSSSATGSLFFSFDFTYFQNALELFLVSLAIGPLRLALIIAHAHLYWALGLKHNTEIAHWIHGDCLIISVFWAYFCSGWMDFHSVKRIIFCTSIPRRLCKKFSIELERNILIWSVK